MPFNPSQRSYDFRARVYYADYAAPTYRGTKLLPIDYMYRIYLDTNNRVVDSDWLGASVNQHPDFMWVPDKPMPEKVIFASFIMCLLAKA